MPLPTVWIVKLYAFCVKVAVTAVVPLIMRETGFCEPEREPVQPLKFQLGAGLAVNVTLSPRWYEAWSGSLATEPLPTVEMVRL